MYSPFFSLQNAVCFNSNVFGSCIIHILYTGVLKFKKNSGAKRLSYSETQYVCIDTKEGTYKIFLLYY